MFVPRIVERDESLRVEVNKAVVAKLETLLRDAKAGKLQAFTGFALDEQWKCQPVFVGDAPCALMASYAQTVANMLQQWTQELVTNSELRYVDVPPDKD